jgi:anti-anti-sigma regulatory factor
MSRGGDELGHGVWHGPCFIAGMAQAGPEKMLRLTTRETEDLVEVKLEGRIAGPWTVELGRVWSETAPRLGGRELALDLSDVTYADEAGKQILAQIYHSTRARLIATTLWTEYLAVEVMERKATQEIEETDNAHHA